jgi:Xaa-Pro aminopeptidase
LPVVGYVRDRVEDSFYVGAGNEAWGVEVFPIWVSDIATTSWSTHAAADEAARFIKRLGFEAPRIALEGAFFPGDALDELRQRLPDATILDATQILEELRAVKTPKELDLIRFASDAIVDSMLSAFRSIEPGMTEKDVVETLRLEETKRGLDFDYALITSGLTAGRAPSERIIESGDLVSLDTAGYWQGYLADMARMAVLGEPSALMKDLLGELQFVQSAARVPVRPGSKGVSIYEAASKAISASDHGTQMTFLAHGMGLIPHEAPRLTAAGPIPYPDTHADRPLEPGMVLSIETHIINPGVGFVKLEDTVAVTEEGWEAFGDRGRNWNVVGAAQ